MGEAVERIEIAPRVPEAAVRALAAVVDPEIPVLTIEDLGVLRGLRMDGDTVVVTITPTYSGCPAMAQIRDDIDAALRDAGISDFRVETRLAPAWTTDWMSEEGRRKLLEYGIAPPPSRDVNVAPTSTMERPDYPGRGEGAAPTASLQRPDYPGRGEGAAPTASLQRREYLVGAASSPRPVACPQCGSDNTRLISEFGSTACKALYQCNACLEPFDLFKCH